MTATGLPARQATMRAQPHGTPGQCVVFWDYDTQWGADRTRNPGRRADWGTLEFEHTERLLDLLAEYDVRACFAVVGAAALSGARPYHDPQQIRRVHEAGHEIASHAFHHEWLPGLGPQALRETLRHSKDALEQCIGAEVVSFVPPYNQPFDYAAGASFSLAERREAGRVRTDLRRLCEALRDVGFRVCRVAYRPLHLRLADRVLGEWRRERPRRPVQIAGVTCLRLNTPVGFASGAQAVLRRCATVGGVVVVYAHPHSLHAGNAQDEHRLVPFLAELRSRRRRGLVRLTLPRDLAQEE